MLVRENVLSNRPKPSHGNIISDGKYYRFTANVGGAYPRLLFPLEGVTTKIGDVYTISYWAKSSTSITCSVVVANSNGSKMSLNITSKYGVEWKKYVIPLICKTDTFENVLLALWTTASGVSNGEILELYDVQINRGNEPSDIWSPPIREITASQQGLMKYGEYKEIETF